MAPWAWWFIVPAGLLLAALLELWRAADARREQGYRVGRRWPR